VKQVLKRDNSPIVMSVATRPGPQLDSFEKPGFVRGIGSTVLNCPIGFQDLEKVNLAKMYISVQCMEFQIQPFVYSNFVQMQILFEI